MTKGGKGLLVVVLVIAVFGAVLVGAGVLLSRKGAPTVPKRAILELDLERGIPETSPDNPFAAFGGERPLTLRDVVDALEKAGDDPHVVGLVARLGAAPIGVAEIQEIRDAVKAFRTKKKFAVAYSETFGEFGPGNGPYYLATAFDEIWLQPSGDLGLNGLVGESPFLRGVLDKLGVKPEFGQRHEFKNAMNQYTETKFTDAHREATKTLIESIYGQMVKGIAEGRKMSEADVRALVDRGPFLGPEALEAKLVDGLAYRDEVHAKLEAKGGAGAKFFGLQAYLKKEGRPHAEGKRTIALVYGIGGVVRGKSSGNPLTGGQTMGSETVAKAIRTAVDDDSVAAILFRVSSPGGSYVASDTIWREVVLAKKAGKPVIISMGDVAASGGYFVAMPADKIVAQPGTITGSIGVLAGKMVTPAMWEKVGLTFDQVEVGANANMWNASKPFSTAEWARFNAWLDRIYEDFTSKVAEGRKLPKERVLEIAKGRVWTGEDAKAIGLVDELGGYATALKLAKAAAKIPAGEKVKVAVFPKEKNPFESLAARMSGEGEDESSFTALVKLIEPLRPMLRQIEAERQGVLTAPPLTIR
ncbi:MAG TPA: signal peptide peptidase SppA [Thermoanaerobaculia bacterium]|nr:signal peptide peptidase SppA [Thermoanaerobaculia bacterium]